MKKLIPLFAILIVSFNLQSQNISNPYASIGKKKPKVATVTNGTYNEFYIKDSLVLINDNAISRKTGDIVYSKKDNPKIIAELIQNEEEKFRFLSLDPIARNFPWNSPYSYAENGPIEAIDLDGLERFKINNSEVNAYDPSTGNTKTYQEKQLTLDGAGALKAKFEVIDEDGISMQTFKYQEFACQMQNFTKTESAAGGILRTPNLKTEDNSAKTSNESTFIIKTDNATPAQFNSTGISISTTNKETALEKNWGQDIKDATTRFPENDPTYNAIQITNGIKGVKTENIIKNLKDNNVIKPTTQVNVIENNSGSTSCDLGNIDCD